MFECFLLFAAVGAACLLLVCCLFVLLVVLLEEVSCGGLSLSRLLEDFVVQLELIVSRGIMMSNEDEYDYR